MSSKNKRAWKYTADNDDTYVRAASGALVTQGGGTPYVGGSAATLTDPPLPPNFRPRYALVQDPVSGAIRKVICYTPNAPLFTGSQTTITLEYNGVDTTFDFKGYRGERPPRKIGQAT